MIIRKSNDDEWWLVTGKWWFSWRCWQGSVMGNGWWWVAADKPVKADRGEGWLLGAAAMLNDAAYELMIAYQRCASWWIMAADGQADGIASVGSQWWQSWSWTPMNWCSFPKNWFSQYTKLMHTKITLHNFNANDIGGTLTGDACQLLTEFQG